MNPENQGYPYVSFIITAYNEEKRISQKLENALEQNYPKEKIEIIVASDCSDDRTDEIVKSYQEKGVVLERAPDRKGKENAQKDAIENAKGDILVFSDVATMLKSDGISNIVKNFEDPSIGCVSSEDRVIDKDGKISGEGFYVKYEMMLRRLESRVNSLVGLSGSFFAARRIICNNWAIDLPSDFNILLNSKRLGLKGVSDPKSIGYYNNIADERKEFDRKARTVLRGISVFMESIYLLNPLKHGIFSLQFFSHKLCRWLVPLFLISAIVANTALLFHSLLMTIVFFMQLLFYCMAVYYYSQIRNSKIKNIEKNSSHSIQNANSKIQNILMFVSRLPYFFVTVNYSILVAWLKYFKGEKAILWEPSKR
ncbi:glycosyltransferase family 2 protein [Desulfobacterales bacterium]|nr:glycosyltransferase family 2 protein [Desulfobacterales bacterium]